MLRSVETLVLLFLVACVGDRALMQHFTVVFPASLPPDSARAAATRLTTRVAQAYHMTPDTTRECELHYWMPADGAGLTLCLTSPEPGTLSIVVWEGFAVRWGPRGDSLRRELGDRLRATFGRRAVKG